MKIRINSTTYDIPTSWDKVKYKDFARFKSELPLAEKLSYQTGIPIEVLTNLGTAALVKILELVQYQDELPEFFEEFHSDLNVGNEHYIKMEQARQALSSQSQWLAAIEIVKLYTGEDISEQPVTKVLGKVGFFLTSCKGSLNDMKHSEDTSRMKMSTQQE